MVPLPDAHNGHLLETITAWRSLLLEGLKPNPRAVAEVVNACSRLGMLDQGRDIHRTVTGTTLEVDVLVATSILNMYTRCGSLSEAKNSFDRIPETNVVSWTSMISAYARYGHLVEALKLYKRMLNEGVRPNHVTFICVIGACTRMCDRETGEPVRSHALAAGYGAVTAVANSLINMLAKFGRLEEAEGVFHDMTVKTSVSWTTMISGYVSIGKFEESLELYANMDVEPDQVTLTCVLDACSALGELESGFEVHRRAEALAGRGKSIPVEVGNALIHMYGTYGLVEEAVRVFEEMEEKRDVISWTCLISVLDDSARALVVFRRMELEGVKPTEVTYATVLAACTSESDVKLIHARLVSERSEPDPFLGAALINSYCTCGSLTDAKVVFDMFRRKNNNSLVVWNSMLVTLVRMNYPADAFKLLAHMEVEGVMLNADTLATICSSCESLEVGKWIRRRADEAGFGRDEQVVSSLVKMFGRLGAFHQAERVFWTGGASQHDVVTWNSIISVCSDTEPAKALEYFWRMQLEGVKPNRASFTCAFAACRSFQQLELLLRLANHLTWDSRMKTAVASMYAKLGRLEDARATFSSMKHSGERDTVSWNSMLAAYAQHGHITQTYEILREMHLEGVSLSPATLSTLLFACSHSGMIEQGARSFRSSTSDDGLLVGREEWRSVVDLVARVGGLEDAEEIIQRNGLVSDPVYNVNFELSCFT